MGITPMAITDRIRTMVIIGLTIGTAGTAITATVTITTISIDVGTENQLSWLGNHSGPALFWPTAGDSRLR